MASVSDAGARSTGRGIVLAGDRSNARAIARRHTAIVRTLKLALPVTAVVVLGGYTAGVLDKTGWGAALEAIDVPQIVAENLAMENPHYEGFNKDGGRYWVTAKKAMQDLKTLSLIKLETITGELIDAGKKRTRLTATRGTFDNKKNVVELFDAIDVQGEDGLTAKLTRATIATKDGIISSSEPVSVAMPAGVITANQMTIRQKEKEYTFVDSVRTELKARDPGPAGAAPAAGKATSFANTNEPITVDANRLDVNDTARTALFTGNVKAVQGEATLLAPELEVSYEGQIADTAQANADKAGATKSETSAATGSVQPSADAGKVKRVIARSPVTLKQGATQQATARTAEFDAIAQTAMLDGDVILSETPDRRAVGDRAEIDQSKNTVLLTGPVVVQQGKNELRGRRLFVDRAAGRMNLTGAGGGNGRIFARFSQAQAASAAAAAKKETPKRGVAFGGNFKTDPNAPVEVAADRLDVDDSAKQAVFAGGVKAQQAGFVLSAAELTANYTGAAGFGSAAEAGKSDAAKLTRIRAKRNVEITSKDGQQANGDWADYDTRANTVTLGGNVVMTQGKNVVRGTKLVIDMTSGESVISTEPASGGDSSMISASDGDGSGMIVRSGRPSAVFYPNEIKERAGKKIKDAADAAAGWQARSAPSQ